jgi:hypothetical protein
MWLWKESNVVMNLQIQSPVHSGTTRKHETMGCLNTPFLAIQQKTLKNHAKLNYYVCGNLPQSTFTLTASFLVTGCLASQSVRSMGVPTPIGLGSAKQRLIRNGYPEH